MLLIKYKDLHCFQAHTPREKLTTKLLTPKCALTFAFCEDELHTNSSMCALNIVRALRCAVAFRSFFVPSTNFINTSKKLAFMNPFRIIEEKESLFFFCTHYKLFQHNCKIVQDVLLLWSCIQYFLPLIVPGGSFITSQPV